MKSLQLYHVSSMFQVLFLKSQAVCQFKMLLNVDKCFRLQAAKVLFLFNINQEWSQVVGQTQITEALLITDSKESNFSSGGKKRGSEGLKKDEG